MSLFKQPLLGSVDLLLNSEGTSYVYLCLERVKINLEIFLTLFQHIKFLSYGFMNYQTFFLQAPDRYFTYQHITLLKCITEVHYEERGGKISAFFDEI